jgi:hypothetical protein
MSYDDQRSMNATNPSSMQTNPSCNPCPYNISILWCSSYDAPCSMFARCLMLSSLLVDIGLGLFSLSAIIRRWWGVWIVPRACVDRTCHQGHHRRLERECRYQRFRPWQPLDCMLAIAWGNTMGWTYACWSPWRLGHRLLGQSRRRSLRLAWWKVRWCTKVRARLYAEW